MPDPHPTPAGTATPAEADAPPIWYARILSSTNPLLSLKVEVEGGDPLDFIHAVEAFRPAPQGLRPARLRLTPRFQGIPCEIADAFRVIDGLLIVSPRFREALERFDLGPTRLHELPILHEDGTNTAYPPHHLLHVAQTRGALVAERSENIRKFTYYGEEGPRPGAPWTATFQPDRLAVSAQAARGADLWADPAIMNRIFFSDRLKRAMDEAGLAARALQMVQATTLP